tara:strand:- start:1011 stop:1208 length:198 start_codon:yes stop_codon:yes gene_type:complete
MKLIILIALCIGVGCASTEYEYQVHLGDGTGTMHLYTGHDKADALEYIKEYEKSHGDMKLVKFKK